ncbi:MAG: hypothetical protein CSB47_01890 [Proteobacteria bacterium]|nr:MAG: hypothetical protein CSB47_01890 [Pseudomonadota bacterium]
MPVTTKPQPSVKRFGLAALTLSLACSLSSSVFAENYQERSVKAIGTLTTIVNKNYIDAPVSKNQIMVAILAANPHAFKGGNINYMLGGVDLRLPSTADIKNISEKDARNLLRRHNYFFRKGRTGNLPAPTFITLTSSDQVEALIKEKEKQTEKLSTLKDETSKLSDLVRQLEEEKRVRDSELKSLEERIRNLQNSSDSLGNTTADLKLKLANGELTGEAAKLLEDLQDRNQSLNAQLQGARSELAESSRAEISLERRINDMQEENSRMAEALKEQGLSPADVLAKNNQGAASTAASKTSDAQMPPTLDTGLLGKMNWLWLLPLLGFVLLVGLLWKLFSGKARKSSRQRAKRASTSAFVDYNQAIDPNAEIEQEPPLEVSIKLDVARAYIESGDYDEARAMIDEVMNEGNTQQQLEAQNILESIPA